MSFVVRDQFSSSLNAYVENFYDVQGPMPYLREKVFPSPTFDLKINLGDAVRAYQSSDPSEQTICRNSWCVGIWSRHHFVEWSVQTRFVGVTFRPGGAYAVLGVPVSELHNRIVPLDAIWGATTAAEISERLGAADSPQRRFDLLEEFLVERLPGNRFGLDMVQYALTQIAKNDGTLTIRTLSDDVGVSQKHLISLFKQIVGGTPKELARLYRFKEILERIDQSDGIDFTTIAHAGHYYDQSHFCRDFRAFTGESPGDFRKLRRQVHAETPDHASHIRLLAVG